MLFLPLILALHVSFRDYVTIQLTTHRILTLQNTALRLITFSMPRTSTTSVFSELSLLKVFDQVKVLNISYLQKFLKNNLPSDVISLLDFEEIDHFTGTRGKSIKLLKLSSVKTSNFGLNSFSRLSAKQWNELQKHILTPNTLTLMT